MLAFRISWKVNQLRKGKTNNAYGSNRKKAWNVTRV